MNLTSNYHHSRTNGTIQHEDTLMMSSSGQQHSLGKMVRTTPPFYLLKPYLFDSTPTGSVNLIAQRGLSRDFDKYVKQPIAPSLSDFLKDITAVETAHHKAAQFASELQGGVGTLGSLLAERIIPKEIVPLTEHQLSAFILHREPALPDMYLVYNTSPKESKAALPTEPNIPQLMMNPVPGPSPQVQRLINEQTPRVSPDVKRKAPADIVSGLPAQQSTTPIVNTISNRTSTGTPTLASNSAVNSVNTNSSYLIDDQDDLNSSKKKPKKPKKERKP